MRCAVLAEFTRAFPGLGFAFELWLALADAGGLFACADLAVPLGTALLCFPLFILVLPWLLWPGLVPGAVTSL